jgi:hypothetical protein
MKKVLLSLLAVVLILGALGAAGFAGYRYGFNQGMLSASDSNAQPLPPGFGFGPERMPRHNFGFDRGFGPSRFDIMHRGIGFGFFSPFLFLARIAFWGLIIWAVYMLVARSGWRLIRTTQLTENPPGTSEAENKE